MTSPPALIAVAHGSSDPDATRAHNGLITRICAAAPGIEVRLAYVDHTSPSVSRVLGECADAGREAVVVPLLLSPASHAKGDIPAAIRAARRIEGGQFTYARVLGPHPLLLQALQRRLAEAGVPDDAALVLAAAGSTDPDANAEVVRVARLLWEWRGADAPVEAAFASATRPGIADMRDRFDRLGYRTVAVASYFLAPGRLPDAVARSAGSLPVSATLADTDEMAHLVLERYGEALAASPPSSCDTCVYRAPWPGHEHRVSAPQRAHRHPCDDAVTAAS